MAFFIDLFRILEIIQLFSLFLVLTNLLTFFLYVNDKRKALKNKWRTKESVLIFFTLAFGGIGAFLAMYFARHKTNTKSYNSLYILLILISR